MRTPEEFTSAIVDDLDTAVGWGICEDDRARVADLIRERDAEVRAATLAGLTEEHADRMVARCVPCDCPGDWQHHARLYGDDSPATHVRHDVVPSRRLVGPWEPRS